MRTSKAADLYVVTFNLKSNHRGNSLPVIYGSCEELGNGDPAKGITLEPVEGLYNYQVKIGFKKPIQADQFWYSYCFKPTFGAFVAETVARRFLPKLEADATIYDSVYKVTAVSDLVVHFRIRCHTSYGQSVYVCGASPELGEWNPEKAVCLFDEGVEDYWSGSVRFPLSADPRKIEYKYFRCYGKDSIEWEPEQNHVLDVAGVSSPGVIEVVDTFRWGDAVLDAFTRSAFVDVVNRRENKDKNRLPLSPNDVAPGSVRVHFSVLCPYVKTHQKLVLVGSSKEMGEWDVEKGTEMSDYDFPFWHAEKILKREDMPFDFKYVIVPEKKQTEEEDEEEEAEVEAIWESENNRYCPPVTVDSVDESYPVVLYVSSWFSCPSKDFFKGLGIYAPVFSLRTDTSCGIGQYDDIKQLVDFCNKVGASLIQLLPINDTTDKGLWEDSYPYRQVSCFALHPIYINLLDITDDLSDDLRDDINRAKWSFEQKREVDYPVVFEYKSKMLKKIFALVEPTLVDDEKFAAFIEAESEWLKPYALYCYLRDKYGTSDFHSWPEHSSVTSRDVQLLCAKLEKELTYTYWLQYVCDKQFKGAREYANEHGVILKGDLPIGVFLNSCECWAWPKNFRLDMCAGAPPDAFASDGQNWGFPTYDWDYMEQDDYKWWRLRLQRMAQLFNALRVDHVLGFFRIWEIPRATCVRGMLGHFFPALPVSRDELAQRGLWDIDRYVRPYVRWHLIRDKFGADAVEVAHKYFNSRDLDPSDDFYNFKEEYNTEKKIDAALQKEFADDPAKLKHYRTCLFQLLGDVMLIPDANIANHYHVRTEVTIEHIEDTPYGPREFGSPSWLELPEPQKSAMKELYTDFTYRRQTGMWISKACKKLDVLKNTTKMLICAEDLGQINEGIIGTLNSMGLLSLRVQRMSKDPKTTFDEAHTWPYLSVACPATHDMSSIRGWWEENRNEIMEFWSTQLWRHDACPATCEPWVLEMIIRQHLWSESMWCIFLLQDLTDLNPYFRRQDPVDERINIPADPNHHWRYRYPYTLSELCDNCDLVGQLRAMVEDSHRI